jgi:hypothetical protein
MSELLTIPIWVLFIGILLGTMGGALIGFGLGRIKNILDR